MQRGEPGTAARARRSGHRQPFPSLLLKGAADQYVSDYHRIYGLRSIVFRQSCIYGYQQSSTEDQGWLVWFTIDGKASSRRIDDLLDAYEAAFRRADAAVGRAYNIGGGPGNALSLLELVEFLENRRGREPVC